MKRPVKEYRNIAYLSDMSGTGFWRHVLLALAVNSNSLNLGIVNTCTQTLISDLNYYRGISSVTVLRWLNDTQVKVFNGFLKPVCENFGAWLLYGIDDAMHYDEIPLYNRGRQAFANDLILSNIKSMLNNADFVITTTSYIKQYYHDKYGVPLDHILAFPNLLPRWWFDDKFDIEASTKDFDRFKTKPRIGIVSSLSHYNIDGIRVTADGKAARKVKLPDGTEIWINQDNVQVQFDQTSEITDDIDEIIQTIRDTVDDFLWVFFGFCPPKLRDLVDAKKIEVHNGAVILNYPSMLKRLHLQAIVAPLKKMTFNFCKSPIKFLECCAIGVPLLAADCEPYSSCMDKSMLFSDNDSLKQKLTKLKFMSCGAYKKLIGSNYLWLNTPHKDGDFNINNCWLEDNIGIWVQLFKMRPKTMHLSFSKFIAQFEARKKEEAERTLVKCEDGVEILK